MCLKLSMFVLVVIEPTCTFSVSSVASPICQEGQSEKNFLIFAFCSRFFLFFFPIFPEFFLIFFLIFPDFWQFFWCQGWHSSPPPLATQVATPLFSVIILSFMNLVEKTIRHWWWDFDKSALHYKQQIMTSKGKQFKLYFYPWEIHWPRKCTCK